MTITSDGFVKCFLCFYVASNIFVLSIGYSIDAHESFFHNLVRSRRAVKQCDGFVCTTSGNCIKPENRCDGKVDCPDGSDEFSDCKTAVECPGYLFTCDYGACIEADKQCNGVQDCRDNSDEFGCPGSTPTGQKVSSNCKSNQFECDNGQCIPRDNKCNGIADCADKSDETKKTCLNMFCPGFTFTCDYGACVDGYAPCNGINDCLDGSDERDCGTTQPNTTTKPVVDPVVTGAPTGGSCILPNYPENGRWSLLGGVQAQPNTKVNMNSVIIFRCDPQYKLIGQMTAACFENGWTVLPPTCEKLCPPLYTTEITHVSCTDQKKGEVKCDQATEGTRAKFECAPYYEPADRSTMRYCNDGSWNLPPPQCIPVCGEKRVTAEPLIVNGQTVEKGDYPWVTAIFQKEGGQFINVCGGSMLTQRVIITAAHCVTNPHDDTPLSVDKLQIGVGKYYRNYKDPRDTQAQYSPVQKVLVRSTYKGEAQRYISDIAFLVTSDTLLLSKVVQPVCYHEINSFHLSSRVEGVITGWGYTQAGGSPSEELKEVILPYKDNPTCEAELPPEWSKLYFTIDKFCAGHYNKSIAVCKGDSGGGLVFPKNGRYYIHGLVSVGHRATDGCDVQISALFTNVAFYSEWLEEVTAKYK